MITNIKNNLYNIDFKAKRIAKAKNTYKGLTTHLEIFKIDPSDTNYLKGLYQKTSIEKLYPNLSTELKETWQSLLKFGIWNSEHLTLDTYLACFNKTPCGIISTTQGKKQLNIIDLISIPIDINKKANLTGQTLFYHIFKNAKKNKTQKITLEALNVSSGNPVEKYKELGFKVIERGNRYTTMECDNENIIKQVDKLKNKINYTECKNKKINLNEYLD
ncbi:hypothetical protein IKB17_05080 [bacterium]|nr:hypothetical protein [bacterium]